MPREESANCEEWEGGELKDPAPPFVSPVRLWLTAGSLIPRLNFALESATMSDSAGRGVRRAIH